MGKPGLHNQLVTRDGRRLVDLSHIGGDNDTVALVGLLEQLERPDWATPS